MDAEARRRAPASRRAAEQRGALAHADERRARRAARRRRPGDGVGRRSSSSAPAPNATSTAPRRRRGGRALVSASCRIRYAAWSSAGGERPRRARRPSTVDVQTGGAVALDSVSSGPGRAAARRRRLAPGLAQRPTSWSISPTVSRATSSIVSSASRVGRVVVAQQPPGAGVDEDHVDRVAGRVVQVARDPRALLGDGQAALALASRSRPASRRSRRSRTRSPTYQDAPHVTTPKATSASGFQPPTTTAKNRNSSSPAATASAMRWAWVRGEVRRGCDLVEGDHRADRRPEGVAQRVDEDGGDPDHREHHQRPAPAPQQGQRRKGREDDSERVETARVVVEAPAVHHRQRRGEREGGQPDVDDDRTPAPRAGQAPVACDEVVMPHRR